jgi:hypothetical protein
MHMKLSTLDRFYLLVGLALFVCGCLFAQSISSGTITGTVTDQSGAAIAGANVTLRNPVSNYAQSATTDQTGMFRLNNIPLNAYQLTVSPSGFAAWTRQLDVRSTVVITESVSLALATANTA